MAVRGGCLTPSQHGYVALFASYDAIHIEGSDRPMFVHQPGCSSDSSAEQSIQLDLLIRYGA